MNTESLRYSSASASLVHLFIETQVDAPCSYEHVVQHTSFAWRNFGPVKVNWGGIGVIVFGRIRQVPLDEWSGPRKIFLVASGAKRRLTAHFKTYF